MYSGGVDWCRVKCLLCSLGCVVQCTVGGDD